MTRNSLLDRIRDSGQDKINGEPGDSWEPLADAGSLAGELESHRSLTLTGADLAVKLTWN
jgi:hypothetical protein